MDTSKIKNVIILANPFVTLNLPHVINGGIEKIIHDMIKTNINYEITLLATHNSVVDMNVRNTLRVISPAKDQLPNKARFPYGQINKLIRECMECEYLPANVPDAIVSHIDKRSVLSFLNKLEVPVVTIMHNLPIFRSSAEDAKYYASLKHIKFVAVSALVRDRWNAVAGEDFITTVVPNMTSEYPIIDVKEEEDYMTEEIVMVGRMDPNTKNLGFANGLHEEIKKTGFTTTHPSDLGYKYDNIDWKVGVTLEEKNEFLRSFNGFCLIPSKVETFGLVAIEMLGHGIPLIGLNYPNSNIPNIILGNDRQREVLIDNPRYKVTRLGVVAEPNHTLVSEIVFDGRIRKILSENRGYRRRVFESEYHLDRGYLDKFIEIL